MPDESTAFPLRVGRDTEHGPAHGGTSDRTPADRSAARTASTRRRPKSGGNLFGRYLVGGISHLSLVLWAFVVVVPLLWAVNSSLKTDAEILRSPWGLPGTLRWNNYVRAWNVASIGDFFLNTAIVTTASLFLTLLLSSLVAFVIATMTFPAILALLPLFFIIDNFGLSKSFPGLIVVYTAFGMPFSVFFLTAFFRSIPDEFLEAARIDGCSYWKPFVHIILPMAKPGLISVGIFDFLSMWNQYLLPLLLQSDKEKYVWSQGLATLAIQQGYKSDWRALFAALVICMIPVLLVYLVFQRQIKVGFTAGGVKL